MQLGVLNISQKDAKTLAITWTDGQVSEYDVVDLRRHCPCAACIDEITRQQLLDPSSIPESVRPVRIASVGRYALGIEFSDGHKSGIYTFEKLRSLN